MKVILISGKARHGKDTTAGFLKNALEADSSSVLVAHYGDLVKYVCKTFFGWDGEKDERGRTLLQKVGTDAIRAKRPDYWVSFISDIMSFFPGEWDYVLVPDCRFPNEVDYIKNAGFDAVHLRVIREGVRKPAHIGTAGAPIRNGAGRCTSRLLHNQQRVSERPPERRD